MAAKTTREIDAKILAEAPPEPKRGLRFYLPAALTFIILVWSFQGAKIRTTELVQGIPQIFNTVARMLPPDFSRVTNAKNYFFPETLSAAELLLPLPLANSQARAKQRWWDNTFPQTVVGATLETVQMALAGTF